MKSAGSVLCFLVLLAGCGSKSGAGPNTAPAEAIQASASPLPSASASVSANAATTSQGTASPAATPGGLDVCALINKEDIAAVQGAPVQSKTPNQQTTGGMVASQCYYSVISADKKNNLSVHLQVMEADAKTPNAVTEYWEKSFDPKNRKARKRGKQGPDDLSGVGEEAVWVDSGKSGILYALHKRKLVRISVGGGADSKDRLAKSKQLMAKALQRVS